MEFWNMEALYANPNRPLMDLAACIVAVAGLPTTRQVYENTADKCLSLLQPALRLWQSEGLIIPGVMMF
jgi:hypothetical protein